MIILGIYPGHDAAVAIIRDGEVVLNLELERFTRIRHDYGFREDFLRFCLNQAGLFIEDIDYVAINGLTIDLQLNVNRPPRKPITPFPVPPTPGIADSKSFTITLLGHKLPAFAINHHSAHLACAYFTSPFKKATVLSIDGGGDGFNASVARGDGNRLRDQKILDGPNLGVLWSKVSEINFGIQRTDPWIASSGPGKLMALASYGHPNSTITNRLFASWIAANTIGGIYLSDILYDSRSRAAQDTSRALQDLTSAYVSEIFSRIPLCRDGNLCYGGGVALNCVANSSAFTESPFSSLHVPPCPNDSGLALGMALYVFYTILDRPFIPKLFLPYLGPVYSNRSISFAINQAQKKTSLDTSLVNERQVAELLSNGEILAVWRQKCECGPRALGHRSILSRPDIKGLRDYLNASVKKREWYRPFAPIILQAYANDVLKCPIQPAPYMTTSATIQPNWENRIKEVAHIDGSTRPQILTTECDQWLMSVMDTYSSISGLPVILNTSFNQCEPMVETPSDALNTFLRMPLRHLLLEDMLISKQKTES